MGNVEDAEKIITHFNGFGQKMKVSYSKQSAIDYKITPQKTAEDEFYLNLLNQEPRYLLLCLIIVKLGTTTISLSSSQ